MSRRKKIAQLQEKVKMVVEWRIPLFCVKMIHYSSFQDTIAARLNRSHAEQPAEPVSEYPSEGNSVFVVKNGMLVSRHPKEPEPGTSLLVVKNGTLVPRNPTPPPPPQISEEALKTAALEKTAQAIAVEITENGLTAEDFCGLLQRTYPDVWEHVKKAWLSKEAVDAYEEAKTAGTARLLRHVTKLVDRGKPVPWRDTDQLAKKVQSTAARQANYLEQNLQPYDKIPNFRSTPWGQTTRSVGDLSTRTNMTQRFAKDLQDQRQDVSNLMSESFLAKLRRAWGTLRRQQKKLLDDALETQKFLRETGVDIGRFHGTIAPPRTPVTPTFDPNQGVSINQVLPPPQ